LSVQCYKQSTWIMGWPKAIHIHPAQVGWSSNFIKSSGIWCSIQFIVYLSISPKFSILGPTSFQLSLFKFRISPQFPAKLPSGYLT
jgi:hypothetical protein